MPDRELHLGYNVLADGMHPAAWRAPYADPFGALDPKQWEHVAQVAERGTLDAIFLADSPSLTGNAQDGPGLAFGPTVLLSRLSAQTEHIGLIATISTHVVPILRARGIFRHEYRGTTLREHLGLERPADLLSAGAVAVA